MSKLQAVSRSRHGQQRWLRASGYSFAAKDSVVPLAAEEMARAVLTMPTAFIENEGAYALVTVQAVLPGRNHWVAADGRWLGVYIPAAYRSYPFQLARTEDGRWALCIDEDSGLLTDDATQGEPFFGDDGKLAKPLAEIMEFLRLVQAAREKTARACAALGEHKLIRPWNIQLEGAGGEPRKVQGLYCVDEEALNAMPAAGLAALRDSGALKLAYAQRLSMQHLPVVARPARGQAQSAGTGGLKLTPAGDLDLEFLNQGGLLNFGKLR